MYTGYDCTLIEGDTCHECLSDAMNFKYSCTCAALSVATEAGCEGILAMLAQCVLKRESATHHDALITHLARQF